MRHLIRTITALALSASVADAQEVATLAATPETVQWPKALVMPWRVLGIDAQEAAFASKALEASRIELERSTLTTAATFTSFLGASRAPTVNAKRLTDKIGAGEPKLAQPVSSVAVEPSWCSIMDRFVVFVTVADATNNRLLASAHASWPRPAWTNAAKNGALANQLKNAVTTLAETALRQSATRGSSKPTDVLHLGLDLGRNVTRADEGSSHCVALLLEEKLAPDFTIARNLGLDRLATARDRLPMPAALRRPNRRVVMRWHNDPERAPIRKLPLELRLDATLAESTMGHPLPHKLSGNWRFALAGEKIDVTAPDDFGKLLAAERATLKRDDWPQIAKIDRAWVYLDRGRAWGLSMGDRLVTTTPSGETIKGHVVKFFGPEAKVTSPRGFAVEEGAILFVRKGQRLTALGQELRMDPRTFPTPYPIPKSSQ